MTEQASPRSVAVLTEVAALDRPLDYLVPEGFMGPLAPGSRVRVDLHGRSVRGWILGEGAGNVPDLKPLKSSLGIGPPSSVVELAQWAAWRWYSTAPRFLGPASPERIVRSLPKRPDFPGLEAPSTSLGALGAAVAQHSEPGLLRLGPCSDPFDLLLGFLAGLGARLETGSALVLVPSIGYAHRLASRLARRGIPAVAASDSWEAALSGWPVVVGTRAGAWAPIPDIAGVLVLDAEDERFSAEGAPTSSAVVIAAERAARSDAPCLLVSAVPTAELGAMAPLVPLGAGGERSGWPQVGVINRSDDDPRNGLLSAHLVEELRAALSAHPSGVAAACLVNRTGRARLLACSRCDQIARCTTCEAAMILDDDLGCPRCGEHRPVLCRGCGATKLKLLRLGTAQIATELEALLGVPVAEVTAASKEAWDKNVRVVVGTEAVLFRLRRTGLVAFLDLDHHLLAPRVGAEQRTLALLGRAGRLVGARGDEGSGHLLVQTRHPEHPVVIAAQHGAPEAVLAADTSLRFQLGLAPARAYALVKGEGAEAFVGGLGGLGIEVSPLGEGRQAVSAPDHRLLADALAGVTRPKGRVVVSVDPAEL